MKIITLFLATFLANLVVTPVYGQHDFSAYKHLFTPPRQYIGYQVSGPINIDGKLTESSWDNVPWSEDFVDIEGDKKPVPSFKTRFKIVWDTQYVYFAAQLEEPHIWATLKDHDAIIFHDNDFEIFLDPDGDTHNYFEIEVNAFNTIFDLFLTRAYRSGGLPVVNWNARNLLSAVSVNGSLNNPGDRDKNWSVEMAIPFSSLNLLLKSGVPKNLETWRVNFSRVQWQTDISNGVYKKKIDTVTNRPYAENNWVWTPQGVVNMHLPERWGYLHFTTQKPGTLHIDSLLPASEQMKKYLWLLYYQQQNHLLQHKKYAKELSTLNFASLVELPGLNCTVFLEATDSQYKASIKSAKREGWQINQEGKINKIANP